MSLRSALGLMRVLPDSMLVIVGWLRPSSTANSVWVRLAFVRACLTRKPTCLRIDVTVSGTTSDTSPILRRDQVQPAPPCRRADGDHPGRRLAVADVHPTDTVSNLHAIVAGRAT